MNKNIFNALIAIFICLSAIVLLVGCGNTGKYSSEKENNNLKLIVYVDDNPNEFLVTVGMQAEVTSFTKSGYYLTGIFDEEEGGTKYFDSNGKSTGVWEKENPTSLYAQWGLFSEISKTFDIKYSDEPQSYGRRIDINWVMKDELLNAVKGNLDKELNVTLTFRIKEGDDSIFSTNNHTNWIKLKDSTNSSAEEFGTKEVKSYVSNYSQYTVSWVAPARCGRKGAIIIEFNRGNTFNSAYIRDAQLSVSFA